MTALSREERDRARAAMSAAIRRGILVRPSACERCGDPGKVEGHHREYGRPLEVEWLCRSCHLKEHGKTLGGGIPGRVNVALGHTTKRRLAIYARSKGMKLGVWLRVVALAAEKRGE